MPGLSASRATRAVIGPLPNRRGSRRSCSCCPTMLVRQDARSSNGDVLVVAASALRRRRPRGIALRVETQPRRPPPPRAARRRARDGWECGRKTHAAATGGPSNRPPPVGRAVPTNPLPGCPRSGRGRRRDHGRATRSGSEPPARRARAPGVDPRAAPAAVCGRPAGQPTVRGSSSSDSANIASIRALISSVLRVPDPGVREPRQGVAGAFVVAMVSSLVPGRAAG